MSRSTASRRYATALVVAVAAGIGIALIDSSPGWDSNGITAGLLLLGAGAAAAISRDRPWLWALLVGLPTPILENVRDGNAGSWLALVFAAVGAAIGWAVVSRESPLEHVGRYVSQSVRPAEEDSRGVLAGDAFRTIWSRPGAIRIPSGEQVPDILVPATSQTAMAEKLFHHSSYVTTMVALDPTKDIYVSFLVEAGIADPVAEILNQELQGALHGLECPAHLPVALRIIECTSRSSHVALFDLPLGDPDAAILVDREAGIVGDLPRVAVRVREVARGAAPVRQGRRLQERAACGDGRVEPGRDGLGALDVDGERDPAEPRPFARAGRFASWASSSHGKRPIVESAVPIHAIEPSIEADLRCQPSAS